MEIKHYKIKFLKNVTEKDLPALPVTIESRVNKAIQERLTVDPVNLGEPLHYSFKGFRRLRVPYYISCKHCEI
ncbi:type II toxin-antitoxin system RelE/ParE family toxin [Wolbachia endosymbiont of Listronotus oregonensis]|uniref:type II toxin-antitoxin system RelE family toxin n=1 Tax=unclassified Wolbachia TaxID=2640676 RepID=UPI00209C992F|nr:MULTISPECIES: type II toxin-antitoxin system RelE/ParE family toxin [Rickettsiales]WMT84772.1 type II toxin-antitoxin system RelE/ParE family toxin [Wolbachia endosymbiont of Listronotus oregonensis]